MSTITHIATCSVCGSSFISQRRVSAPSGEILHFYLFCATCAHQTKSVSEFAELDNLVRWYELPAKNVRSK